jgi:hypothetical protein
MEPAVGGCTDARARGKTRRVSPHSTISPGFQLELVKAEKTRRRLKEFVIQAWPVLEPITEFVDGIPMDAICAHLPAVTEGRIAHLIVNAPPGHAKSLLVCVFWPAWVYGSSTRNPDGCSPAIASHWRSGTA